MDTKTTSASNHSLVPAGLGGLGFMILVLAENVLRGAPVPNNSELPAIIQYYTEKQSMLMISHSLFILTIPCLLIYGAGLFRLLRDEASPDLWARTGWGVIIIMPVSFSVVVINDIALTSMAANIQPGIPYALAALFKLHAIAFIVNAAVLGTVMLGFGKAALQTGRVSKWLSVLAITGGVLLILSAVPAHLVLAGSMWGMLGLAGFLCWLIWVAVTSIQMIKRGAVN